MIHLQEEHVQAFRSVHKSWKPSTITYVDPDDIIHIECYTDPETHIDFILWDEIKQAFEEALFVRNKTKMLPYLKGSDYRPIEPKRIAAIPNVVLDVVVGGEVAPLTSPTSPSPQQQLQRHHQQIQQQAQLQQLQHQQPPQQFFRNLCPSHHAPTHLIRTPM
ncbi:hypothetical protein BG015_011106 [Linnemannia schmuckeri]|uniref:Uncharacterized protein n=1 Tax=Linnemannia schmuckeri TaxID=64567 RepID=A0A9P5RV82_9FUNG|nr:hypothetical protein BG015_011106 [Linnemannia schmuckeri]